MITLIDLLEIQRLKSGSDDLFDLLNGAEFDERIDREVLNNKILSDLGACIPLYDTTDTFRVFYNNYFKVKAYTIRELLDTLEYEYNPIWNKDGTITVEREGTHNEQINRTGRDTDDGTTTEVPNTTTKVNGSVENLVSAENVSDYQADNKSLTDSTTTESGTNISTLNNVRNTTSTDIHNGGENDKEVRVEQGNIGVTSTQSLIEEQRNVVKFNVYDWLINDIKNELFVLVY